MRYTGDHGRAFSLFVLTLQPQTHDSFIIGENISIAFVKQVAEDNRECVVEITVAGLLDGIDTPSL